MGKAVFPVSKLYKERDFTLREEDALGFFMKFLLFTSAFSFFSLSLLSAQRTIFQETWYQEAIIFERLFIKMDRMSKHNLSWTTSTTVTTKKINDREQHGRLSGRKLSCKKVLWIIFRNQLGKCMLSLRLILQTFYNITNLPRIKTNHIIY